METVNQENNATTETTEKTFTQAEVDAIIGDRLSRERAKYSDYASLKEKADAYDEYTEQNKTELQKANDKAAALQKELNDMKQAETIRGIREKISSETGVPANLLTADTEDTCREQANAIKAFAKPAYPNVLDGGEPTGTQRQSTAQQFADWFSNNY